MTEMTAKILKKKHTSCKLLIIYQTTISNLIHKNCQFQANVNKKQAKSKKKNI